jgi:hypothetical protein
MKLDKIRVGLIEMCGIILLLGMLSLTIAPVSAATVDYKPIAQIVNSPLSSGWEVYYVFNLPYSRTNALYIGGINTWALACTSHNDPQKWDVTSYYGKTMVSIPKGLIGCSFPFSPFTTMYIRVTGMEYSPYNSPTRYV